MAERSGGSRSLAAQLRDLESSWSAVARALLARRWAAPGLDITHPQYFALQHLCDRKVVPLGELAYSMRMTEPVAARLVDRLVRAGLVGRRLDPSDRRTVLVEPTTHGRTILSQVRRVRFDELAAMLRRLDAGEREQLIALFRKMAAEADDATGRGSD